MLGELRTLATMVLLGGTILLAQNDADKPIEKIEVISDTKGADFGPYLKKVTQAAKQNWLALTMNSPGLDRPGPAQVTVQFSIQRDGSVSGVKLAEPSGNSALDRAALDAIANSSPLLALPESFPDQQLALRFHFHRRSGSDMSGNCGGSNNGAVSSANPASTSDCSQDGRDGVYHIGRGGSIPRKISGPEPEFTGKARKAKLQGTVTLRVIVTAEGTTRDITVEKSIDPGLDQKAIDAVSKWKFEPAMKDGQPVAVTDICSGRFQTILMFRFSRAWSGSLDSIFPAIL